MNIIDFIYEHMILFEAVDKANESRKSVFVEWNGIAVKVNPGDIFEDVISRYAGIKNALELIGK